MASLTGHSASSTPAPEPDPEARFVFARATAAERYEALSVLLTGQSRRQEAAVESFLQTASEQNLSLDNLWIARPSAPSAAHGQGAGAADSGAGRIVAAVLAVGCAGRTAMLFVSPVQRAAQVAAVSGVIRAACEGQDPAKVKLVQAMLDPGQDAAAAALKKAGFTPLANLVYMQRAIGAGDVDAPALFDILREPGVRVLPWAAGNRALFEKAILASYQETLDCPGLLGLRTIEEIIEGHMATGRFVPSLWHALYKGEEPIGVMLLSAVLSRQAMELVYLGLSVPWRGRGLAKKLLHTALAMSHAHGATSMLLAVDESNTPAMRLYKGLGFSPHARKMALIRATKGQG